MALYTVPYINSIKWNNDLEILKIDYGVQKLTILCSRASNHLLHHRSGTFLRNLDIDFTHAHIW